MNEEELEELDESTRSRANEAQERQRVELVRQAQANLDAARSRAGAIFADYFDLVARCRLQGESIRALRANLEWLADDKRSLCATSGLLRLKLDDLRRVVQEHVDRGHDQMDELADALTKSDPGDRP